MAELAGEDQAARVLIEVRSDPTGAPVVSLTGELDMSNADALKNTLASITARRPPRLTFELSGLRFIDSAGIAVLLEAAEQIDAVHVREPSQAVRRVLELTGLVDVLTIEPGPPVAHSPAERPRSRRPAGSSGMFSASSRLMSHKQPS